MAAETAPGALEGAAKFRSIIDSNADGIVVVGADGIIRLANPAAAELFGLPAPDLVGTLFGVPVVPGETTVVDLVHGGQGLRAAEMRVVEALWEGQRVLVASLRDITARRRFLEEAASELAASLDYPGTLQRVARLAITHLADACVVDLTVANPEPRRAVAHRDPVREAQLISALGPGPGLADATVRTGRAEFFPDLADCPENDEAVRLSIAGCRCAAIVPLAAQGRVLGAVTLLRDDGRGFNSTDLALAEELAGRAALAIDNARLYDEARAAVRQRDEFLAMLAHELRNPLAPILNAARLAQLRTADAESRRLAAVIERQGRHMARMLDDLLDVSRITCGKVSLRCEPVELSAAAREAVETARPLLESRGHRLTLTLPQDPLWLEADSTRLGQVLANLLNNAAKYTHPGGHITLSVAQEGGTAVVRVSDNGAGISAEMLPHVFEPFEQASQSLDRAGGGLGLGLTLVQRLVELHGGSVVATSAGPGRGSEFTVRLPLPGAPRSAAPRGDEEAAAAPRRVVLVEDNADARGMLKELLELMGHRVAAAGDGEHGTELILSDPPEVALIDLGLPGVSGYEVARRVRDAARGTLLVALTGYGQPDDRRRTAEAGFDMHLVKPVDLAELTRVLSGVGQAGRTVMSP